MKKLLFLLLFIPGIAMADTFYGEVVEVTTRTYGQWKYVSNYPKVKVVISDKVIIIGEMSYSYSYLRNDYNNYGQEQLHIIAYDGEQYIKATIVEGGKNYCLIYFYYKDGSVNCFKIRYL